MPRGKNIKGLIHTLAAQLYAAREQIPALPASDLSRRERARNRVAGRFPATALALKKPGKLRVPGYD